MEGIHVQYCKSDQDLMYEELFMGKTTAAILRHGHSSKMVFRDMYPYTQLSASLSSR